MNDGKSYAEPPPAAGEATPEHRRRERLFLILIGLITAAGPLTLQIYLPALPAVRTAFHATVAEVQLTLSLPMVVLAPALLAYGPLADRWGRRPVMLGGLALFLSGSVMCLLSTDLPSLAVGRVIQTIGASAGLVLGRAMLTDRYAQRGLAGKIAGVTVITVLTPTVAPIIGGVLIGYSGWRGIFVALLLIGLLLTGLTIWGLAETAPRAAANARGSVRPLEALASLLRRKTFLLLALQCAFSQAVFLTFISFMPHLMIERYSRPAAEYGAYFLALAAGYVAGNLCTTPLSRRFSPLRLVAAGSLLALCATAGIALLVVGSIARPPALFACMTIVVFANGITNPNAQATALAALGSAVGAGAGSISFLQQICAALMIQSVAWFADDALVPLALTLLGSSMLAMLCAQLAHHGRAQAELA